jgi:dihydroorotate dehydrogenase electron transfer subunit
MSARQTTATVAAIDPVGAYHLLTLREPGLGKGFQPGQFTAVAVGGEQTSMLLRRCFSIHRAKDDAIQIVVAESGRGTRWLVRRSIGDVLDVVTPLGRPFPLPQITRSTTPVGSTSGTLHHRVLGRHSPTGRDQEPARPAPGRPGAKGAVTPSPDYDRSACVLVGGGYGSAPLLALSDRLRARGHPVHIILGAASEQRLFGVAEAKAFAESVTVTTDDGSVGQRGWVSDVLPDVLAGTAAEHVYACGPMGMLAAVTKIASSTGAQIYCAVEESMACGIGVCMTCVLPVVGDDGLTRMTRSCTDGPVFDGFRVRWDDIGTVPPGCVGAPTQGAYV